MSRELRIIPECNVETLLMQLMGFGKTNHEHGINNVTKAMEKQYKNRLAIGIVDNDKIAKHPYYQEFNVIETHDHFLFKQRPDTQHFVIVFTPDFEYCIFNIAKELGIDPKKDGFKNVKQFKKFTRTEDVADNERVKIFLNRLIYKKNSPLQYIHTWIRKKLNND